MGPIRSLLSLPSSSSSSTSSTTPPPLAGSARSMLCRYWLLSIALLTIFPSTVQGQSCIHDLFELQQKEQRVTDTGTVRTYIICPNKVYDIGMLDYDNNLKGGRPGDDIVYPPLPLRPNLVLKCGNDGARSNQCWMNDGQLQIDGTAIMGITNPTVNNVIIQGFTFMGAMKHSIWVTKPGSITFRDCEWKDFTRSEGPIMLDYYNAERNDELVVTFENCHFRENRYFGMGSQTSLIIGTSDQNRIKVAKTVFTNNDMKWNTTTETTTFLIESLGPTQIEDSCFVNNKVVSSGVAVYGNTLQSTRVHSSSSGGNLCAFASVFQTLQQFETRKPLCIAPTNAVCDLIGSAPTPPPVKPVNQYIPFTINALEYDEASEKDTVLEGGCNREGILPSNGPDAQNSVDSVCLQYGGCHVSHTLAGEYLVYRFAHLKQFEVNGVVIVDVKVRMSSATPKEIKLELLYNGQVTQQTTLFTAGTGSASYTDIVWKNVPLRGSEVIHAIRVNFVNGGTNFCAIGINYSSGTGVPIITPAPTIKLAPSPAPTLRPLPSPAPTKKPTVAPVGSALPTKVPTLPPQSSPTPTKKPTVAPTPSPTKKPTAAPVGSALPTKVPTLRPQPSSAPTKKPTVAPVGSALPTRVPTLRPQPSSAPTKQPTVAPTRGPTKRPTVAPTGSPTKKPTAAPVGSGPSTGFSKVWTALEYSAFSDSTPATFGSCNTRGDGVDAQPTTDSVCNTRDKSFCNIAWWDPNEYLKYRFTVPTGGAGSYSIRIRAAAGRDGKTIGIELSTTSDGVVVASSTSFVVRADGFQTFNDIVWTPKVALKEIQYDIRVFSATGSINMCSVAIIKSNVSLLK